MNVAFFLVPKKEIIYLPLTGTMRQALEKMEHHRYSAVPLIDKQGKYAGTITDGALLWKLKNTPGLTFDGMEKILIKDIPRHRINRPVHIRAEIEELFKLAAIQNFVPVIDDEEIFIGIITRRRLLEYFTKLIIEKETVVKERKKVIAMPGLDFSPEECF